MALVAQFLPLPNRTALGARWKALEAQADAAFFLSWTWVGAWLASYDVRPELLAVTDEAGADVALALVVPAQVFGDNVHGRLRAKVEIAERYGAADAFVVPGPY